MKKQFVYLPLFLLITNLQAGPKGKKDKLGQAGQITTEQQSTGSKTLLPVDLELTQQPQATSPLAPNPLSEHHFESTDDFDDDFNSPASSHRTSPVAQIVPSSSRRFTLEVSPEPLLEAPPAIACQTTMRNFNAFAPKDHKDDSGTESDSEEDPMVTIEGVEGMVDVQLTLIQKLEQRARRERSLLDSTIETLEKLGALKALEMTQDLALNLAQTRLQRILSLDNSHGLRPYLGKMTDGSEQGEWLAKGLAQAVETKNIDHVTRVLEIIQNYELTNFVPTQHQEDASQLLLQHTKKIASKILPHTQRISNPGDLSPRSKASHKILEAVFLAHNPMADPGDFITTTLKHLQDSASTPK